MSRTRKRAAPAPAPAAASGFGALSAGEAHTVLQLLLPKLQPFERARAGAVNRAWRDAALVPDVWARVDLEDCAKKVDALALEAICTRAGAALTELLVPHCQLLTMDALLYALSAGGCVGLRTLTLPQPAKTRHTGWPPLQLALLGDAAAHMLRFVCPALEKLTATLLWLNDGEVTPVAQLFPGASFALVVRPSHVLGAEAGTRRCADLSHPSVTSVLLRFPHGDDGLTEEAAVALAELAMPPDTEQPDSTGSADPKRAPLFRLELVGSAVGDATAAAVAAALRAPRCALRELQLWGGALTDSGVTAIADALAVNARLLSLHFQSFTTDQPVMGDVAARALAAAMRENSTLTFLSVTGEFSDAACADLFAGLTGHAGLRTLSLHNTGTEAMGGLAGSTLDLALRAPSCRLEVLWLQFCGGFVPDASAALGTGVAGNTSLRKLQIYSKTSGDTPASQLGIARALRSALLVNTTLQSLDFTELDGRAIAALAPALAVHPSLTDVDLSFSKCSDAGALALARALAAPTCACVRLDVQWSGIAGRGGEALADALRHNTRLKELEVRDNQLPIDSPGRALRANAASRLTTLSVDQSHPLRVLTTALDLRGVTSLTLHDFSFKFVGDAATLAAMLSQPRCALRKLHLLAVRDEVPYFLRQNVFRRLDVVTLASGLSRNTSLTWLNIEGVSFDVENATTLGRALRGHPRLAMLQFADSRWYPSAALALVRALCAADDDEDDGSHGALTLMYLAFTTMHDGPLNEEEAECCTLMDLRQPYPLVLMEHPIA